MKHENCLLADRNFLVDSATVKYITTQLTSRYLHLKSAELRVLVSLEWRKLEVMI